MKVMYLGKPVVGRRGKTLILVFLVAIILYFLISHFLWPSEGPLLNQPVHVNHAPLAGESSWDWLEDDRKSDDAISHSVPMHLIRQNKCPACFGDDICEDIHSGDLQIEIPKTPTSITHKGVYFGRWQGKDIVVKTLDNLSSHNFEMFDKFICRNQSLSEDCDVSAAIQSPRSIAVQESSFLPENLQQAWKIAHTKPHGLSFAACATSKLVQELSWGFDLDHDGQLNEAQVAMLYTSMVINPEAILLRFFSNLKVEFPVPEFLGACGRMVVASHGGTSLSRFVTSPFLQRAELALQALEMVHLFIYGDPAWFILFGDYKMENFAVNSDGQLIVVDLEDMAIIDKRHSQNFQFGQVEYNTPCNENCFQSFAEGMYETSSPFHDQFCEQAPHVAGMAMYALLCSNILADKDTRARKNLDGISHHEKSEGLLASLPSDQESYVHELLEECIEESNPAGRVQAVQELKEWLEDMLDKHTA